jgi:hypothetical protein
MHSVNLRSTFVHPIYDRRLESDALPEASGRMSYRPFSTLGLRGDKNSEFVENLINEHNN